MSKLNAQRHQGRMLCNKLEPRNADIDARAKGLRLNISRSSSLTFSSLILGLGGLNPILTIIAVVAAANWELKLGVEMSCLLCLPQKSSRLKVTSCQLKVTRS